METETLLIITNKPACSDGSGDSHYCVYWSAADFTGSTKMVEIPSTKVEVYDDIDTYGVC